MIKVGIIGATGYAGAEIVRLLYSHPQAQIVWYGSRSYVDERFASIYKNMFTLVEDKCLDDNILELSKQVDVIFTATPQGYLAGVLTEEILSNCKVIDLSADYRIKDVETYEKWYGITHKSPQFIEEAVYGLCEINRDKEVGARLIANPGCYTTCSILTAYPLVKAGLIDPSTLIIDAKSGTSGAGRGAKLPNLYSENSYKQAQASVAQARASVNRAKVNLGFCTITASVTGIIGAIPVRAGDQVSPATQLTVLSGNTTMDAEFSVPEAIIEESVQSGATKDDKAKYMAALPDVTFVMKNGTEYPHKGRVTSLTGVVDAATGSLGAKASFPNPDGHLFSGIQGTLVLPLSEKDVIVIPQNAVVKLQDKSLVYKVNPDSTATAVTVTTANTGNGKDVIVISGLNVGDKIVTTGANNVQEGQKVLFPEEVK